MRKMTTVAIPSELRDAIKEYILDFEDYEIGQFIEDAVFFALDPENIEDFEASAGIDESEDNSEEQAQSED